MTAFLLFCAGYFPAYVIQTGQRFVQCVIPLCKMKSYEIVHRLAEEARSGNGADADIACEHLAEFEIGLVPEFRSVEQDELFSLRHGES